MAIITVMKENPKITLEDLNTKVSQQMRSWTYNQFHPCNNAIGRWLGEIEAMGFIKRQVGADKSVTLVSDFHNMRCTALKPPKDDDGVDEPIEMCGKANPESEG